MALLGILALALAALASGQESCPSSCYCDAQLSVNCVGDSLWRFPFGIPRDVTRLELRSYVIDTLTAAQLAAFVNLTELKVPHNHITTVENGTFITLKSLLKLDLSQNVISEVEAATFEGLTQTKNLDLSSNRLSSCEGAFSGLKALEQLTLRNNNLTFLGPRTLDGLIQLQYLNVDSNLISHIDVSAFHSLPSLAHLILSNNPLSNLSRLEFFGSRLQYIDVSAVGLTRVPQSLTQYVRDLRLAKNNFSVLRRGDFDSYPYLGLLVLDDSGISRLEEDALGRHEYLMRLWMNGNLLQSVPASLPPSLKALYLEENRITVLRADDFKGLTVLEQLFMQRNLIETVESCAFCGLTSLKSLDLQANRIQRLATGSFSGLIALESLDLSQNPIVVMEDKAFASFLSLRSLQLSRLPGNISVPDTLFDALDQLQELEMYDSPLLVERVINSGRLMHGIHGLTRLNIMHNQLTSLRSDLPALLPQLQLLKLGGSWWDCSNPDILWLTDWMAEGQVQFYRPFSVRCRQPPPLLLKSVALLQRSDFVTMSPVSAAVPTAGTSAVDDSRVMVPTATQTTDRAVTTAAPAATPTTDRAVITATPAVTPTTDRAVTTATPAVTPTTDRAVAVAAPAATPTADRAVATAGRGLPAAAAAAASATGVSPTFVKPTSTFTVASAASRTTPPAATAARLPPITSVAARPVNVSTAAATIRTPAPLPTTARSASPGTAASLTPAAPNSPAEQSTRQPPPAATTPQPDSRTAPRRPADVGSTGRTDQPGRINYVPTGRRGTIVAVVSSMAIAIGVILLMLAGAVCLWHYRRVSVYPFTRRRKGSSISYSQQKDEVNILHESCGYEETSSEGHHGLTNTLYFMAQRGEAEFAEVARPRPASLLPHADVDACPRAVADAWATPSPDARQW